MSVVPAQRARQQRERARLAESLSPRARRVWRAWQMVGGQITVINPNASKASDIRVKLDTEAIVAGIRMADIPPDAESQAWAWEHVLMLHDIACHGGANVTRAICFAHGTAGKDVDVEAHPDCDDCRAMLGVED